MTEAPAIEDEIAILARVLGDETGRFPDDLARYILGLGFGARDLARIDELTRLNQADSISPAGKRELIAFVNAGDLLATLKSRARKVLGGPSRDRH